MAMTDTEWLAERANRLARSNTPQGMQEFQDWIKFNPKPMDSNAAAVSDTAIDEPTTTPIGDWYRDKVKQLKKDNPGLYDTPLLEQYLNLGKPIRKFFTPVTAGEAAVRDAPNIKSDGLDMPVTLQPSEPELSAVDIDALMKKYYPDARPVATGAVTAPVGASTTTTPGNKIDYAKILMDRATARDTRAVPSLENPNTEADLTERMRNIKVPTRPGLSDLSDDDKNSALVKMGLTMMGGASPFFSQNVAAGGTAGLNDAEKSRDTMMKDLMTKYGIDADMAMKLATARGSDLAGRNVNATSKYNMGTQNLAAGDAAIGSAGTVANAAEMARLKAISDADENNYRTGILKRYERVDENAATRALDERRAKEPGYQFLEAERMRNQFKDTPLEKRYDQFISTRRKGETRKDRLEALIKSSEPIRKEEPGSARARAYELIILNWDKYGDDPDKLVEIINAAERADAKNRK